MTVFYSGTTGNPKNKVYAKETDDLTLAAKFDHVMCKFEGNTRAEEKYIFSDILYGDIDNSETDKESEWMTIDKFSTLFHDYEWYICTSRNHMKEKGGKAARPKFHVYFPIKKIEELTEMKNWLLKLTSKYTFFDPAVKDAARFFFGNPNGSITHNKGKSILEDLQGVEAITTKKPLKTKHEDIAAIPQGERNSTLFRMGCKWVNMYPEFDDVIPLMEQANEAMENPLPAEELEQVIGSVSKYADEQKEPDTYNGKKIIRNYTMERKVVKTKTGKRKTKVMKLALDFTKEMDEPKNLFAAFIDGSGKRYLFKMDGNYFLNDSTQMDFVLKSNGYLLDFNCPNASITEKKLMTYYTENCDGYERLSIVPEINRKPDTLYRCETIEPKQNGSFMNLIKAFTLKSEKDRYRFVAGLLSPFLNSDFDGEKPLFAVMADIRSSGKTDIVRKAVAIIHNVSPLEYRGADDDQKQLCGIQAFLNPNVLYDNIKDISKADMLNITTTITDKYLPSHVMFLSHSRVRNNKTFWCTFNSEESLDDDVLNRILPIWMRDGRDVSADDKAKISSLLDFAMLNRHKIVADLLYHLGQVDWTKDVPTKKHPKFGKWCKMISKPLAYFFPAVEEFDFSISEDDKNLSSEHCMMTEFLEELLGDKDEVFYSTKTCVDRWKDMYRSGTTTANSLNRRMKNMAKSLENYMLTYEKKMDKMIRATGWTIARR